MEVTCSNLTTTLFALDFQITKLDDTFEVVIRRPLMCEFQHAFVFWSAFNGLENPINHLLRSHCTSQVLGLLGLKK